MKKLLAFILLASSTAANAGEIRSTIVDSVQLTVEGPAVQSTRIGSQYTVSGSNITATTLGGLSGSSATAPAVRSTGNYSVTTDGQAFSFSEYDLVGDVTVTSQSALSGGQFSTPNLYGDSITSSGGTAGALAGTLSSTGVPAVTAGGSGTTAIGQRSVELSVFQ
jgi:hypothetical protein